MTTRLDANMPGRAALSEQDLIIAELFDRYIQRRQRGNKPYANDLLAAAAEHGDTATDVLRVLLASYDATRARDRTDRGQAIRWTASVHPVGSPQVDAGRRTLFAIARQDAQP